MTKIITSQKVRDLEKQVIMPVTTTAIGVINPGLAILISFLYGSISTINDWKKNRLEEMIASISEETIIDLIKGDDKVKNVLYDTTTKVFQEPVEEKRQYFYTYLKNIASRESFDFDYHTKISAVLVQILPGEIQLLQEFKTHYEELVEFAMKKQVNGGTYTHKNLNDRASDLGVNITEMEESHIISVKYSHDIIEQRLTAISGYGLLFQRIGRMDGTYYGPVTEFGNVFMDFVLTKPDMEQQTTVDSRLE